MKSSAMRLGDILVEQSAISRTAIEAYAPAATCHLGSYLRAHNLISGYALAHGIAQQHGLAFIDFTHTPPDSGLFRPSDLEDYIAHQYVPFAKRGKKLVFATTQPSKTLQAKLQLRYDRPVELVVTGARDLSSYFTSVAATASTRRACLGLRRKFPGLTADRTMTNPQLLGLGILAASLILACRFAPYTSWFTALCLSNIFYIFSILMKLLLLRFGHRQQRKHQQLSTELAHAATVMDESRLPTYTVLVPLYMESAEVVNRLVSNLAALDYPPEKLDIKLICEADDFATLRVLKAAKPPRMMEIIAVPPSRPRTKPKACNVALQHIRGEYLVIYDAEDAPPRDQLKRAIALFERLGPKTACLQAALNYYNRDENLLTQLFALEYSGLFQIALPALEAMRLPIPLGGTSNHLRVSALREAGGWDAFNVTEDADLGMRLAYLGYHTHILPSLTLEEAPIGISSWLKQRTRWIKGYVQTWLVYMRNPRALKRRLGAPAYYGFQFFVGAPVLTFILGPVLWLVSIGAIAGWMPPVAAGTMLSMCLTSLIGGIVCNWLFARSAIQIEGWMHMRRALLVYPFYWFLHSAAAAMAIFQLATRPHYWGKTKHGVSRMQPQAPSQPANA